MNRHVFSRSASALIAAGAFLLPACSSLDEEFAEVPDFEVRKVTFEKERKLHPNVERDNRYYVLRWNILGPIEPEGKSIETSNFENEAVLNGFCDAPETALWHVRAFHPGKNEKPGVSDFSGTFRKVNKPSVFYLCATLLTEEEYKNVTMHISAPAGLQVYLNGKSVLIRDKNEGRGQEIPVPNLALRKGFNRLVIKYRENASLTENSIKGAFTPWKRFVSVRFTMTEKKGASEKSALIH